MLCNSINSGTPFNNRISIYLTSENIFMCLRMCVRPLLYDFRTVRSIQCMHLQSHTVKAHGIGKRLIAVCSRNIAVDKPCTSLWHYSYESEINEQEN